MDSGLSVSGAERGEPRDTKPGATQLTRGRFGDGDCSGSRLETHRIVVTPLIARTLSFQWMKLHMVLSYTDPGDSVRGRGRLDTGYPDSSPLGAGLNWALSTLTL